MLKALYISTAAALNNSERYDVIANNLANVSTPGFKPQRPQFHEVFLKALASGRGRGYLAGAAGAAFTEAKSVFRPGPLKFTGRPLDFAINGEGLFSVERDGKILFTRAGNFRVGSDGYLMTADGRSRVLLENGIPILVGNAEIEMDRSGIVFLKHPNGNKEQLGYLWILRPKGGDFGLLRRKGDNLYEAPLSQMERVEEARVQQGALEQSSASAVKEMVEMISAMRAFEASLQFVKIMDSALGQAMELARPLTA